MQHEWVSERAGGPPDMAESNERVVYCRNCGAEQNEENASDECPAEES
jgi:hypothetical protein